MNAEHLSLYWESLVDKFLPEQIDSYWRSSRVRAPDEPEQGWKLHVSATILQACDLFSAVAPLLIEQGVQFKAPPSLDELQKINSGIDYGYGQVGKFLTVYPSTESDAVWLARRLHELTAEFIPVAVPFDRQYASDSNVFYRYGAFSTTLLEYEQGKWIPVVFNNVGIPVPDDRRNPVPGWISDPFPQAEDGSASISFAGTPLGQTYRIFAAITQRGKGGTYAAVDTRGESPLLCIIKEGRRHGEVDWDGRDGYDLAERESRVLNEMQGHVEGVPKVYSTFEVNGSLYIAIECVAGKSLQELFAKRRRLFSLRTVIEFGIEIAEAIRIIHDAGWVWNDCKPANIMITPSGKIRPIDFEAAYKIGTPEPFIWRTPGYGSPDPDSSGPTNDLYSLGAVLYFLLTAKMYDSIGKVPIAKLRRRVPDELRNIVVELLESRDQDVRNVKRRLEKLLKSLN